jgi:single-stranded DNA-specific DHH superfamily exonuclease
MITKKQIKEIREHLEKAQNPIFFFDNDNDGLCSFLILRRYLGRGKGIAVKSFPDMNAEYFRRVTELNSDYIFILDKPVVNPEFFEEAKSFNIPIVWIDHHKTDQTIIPDFVHYYNSAFKGKKNEPVTYLCYQIAERKEDLWLGVVGCISDRFFPDFYKDFFKVYPDLAVKGKDAFDIFYKSQIGNIAKIFSFALKDTTSNVMKLIYFLVNVKTPYEVLEETAKNKGMHSRFKQIYRKYEKLVEKAKALADDSKILFFQYGGDMSISADLSNELTFLFPKKIIIVAKVSGLKANISLRGIKIREPFLKAIKNIEGATGGGHENAVGGQIKIEDLEKFRENLEKEFK